MTKKVSIVLLVLIVLIITGMTTSVVGSNGQGNGPGCNKQSCKPPASGVDIYVGGATQGHNGDNVTVYVNITNADNITDLQFDLLYNKSVLNANNVTNGSAVLTGFSSTIDNTTGIASINIGCGHPCDPHNPHSTARVDGTEAVAIINFTVVGLEGSMSYLNISGASARRATNPKDVELNVTNSTFYVPDITAPIINSVTLDNNTPIPGQDINISVNATDNVGVVSVETNGTVLSHQGGNIWNGTITAIEGNHSVNVSARDAAGNVGWNNSTTYIAEYPINNGGGETIEPTPTPTVTSTDTYTPGAPYITYADPDSLWVNDTVGTTRTFSIKINQTVDVKWYVLPIDADLDDKYLVDTDSDVRHSSYTSDAEEGIRQVTAVVSNDNGDDSQDWNWNVQNPDVTPTDSATPTPTDTVLDPTATQTTTPDPTITPTPTPTPTPDPTPTPTPTSTPTCLIPEGCNSVTPTPTNSHNGGSGDSGGFDNSKIIGEADVFEEVEADLSTGIPTTYSFNAYDFAIYQMVVVSKENDYKVDIRVTKVKDRSKFTSADVPEIVYTNESVTSDTQRLSDVIIRFRVNNSWANNNDINATNIQLYKLENGSWKPLETSMKNKDDKYTYFESFDTGVTRWQLFTISGIRSPPPEVTHVVVTPVATPESPVTSQVGGSMPWPATLVIVLGLIVGTLYYRNKQKVNKEDKEKKE